MIASLLIANRGEIACRVIRTALFLRLSSLPRPCRLCAGGRRRRRRGRRIAWSTAGRRGPGARWCRRPARSGRRVARCSSRCTAAAARASSWPRRPGWPPRARHAAMSCWRRTASAATGTTAGREIAAGVDDVGFIRAMLADLRGRDRRRPDANLRDRRVERRTDELSPRLRGQRAVPGGRAGHRQHEPAADRALPAERPRLDVHDPGHGRSADALCRRTGRQPVRRTRNGGVGRPDARILA